MQAQRHEGWGRPRGSIDFVREALSTGCPDYETCWRPVHLQDAVSFNSTEAVVAWAALFILCLAVLIRRLMRG
jgi:hypothetical protein